MRHGGIHGTRPHVDRLLLLLLLLSGGHRSLVTRYGCSRIPSIHHGGCRLYSRCTCCLRLVWHSIIIRRNLLLLLRCIRSRRRIPVIAHIIGIRLYRSHHSRSRRPGSGGRGIERGSRRSCWCWYSWCRNRSRRGRLHYLLLLSIIRRGGGGRRLRIAGLVSTPTTGSCGRCCLLFTCNSCCWWWWS